MGKPPNVLLVGERRSGKTMILQTLTEDQYHTSRDSGYVSTPTYSFGTYRSEGKKYQLIEIGWTHWKATHQWGFPIDPPEIVFILSSNRRSSHYWSSHHWSFDYRSLIGRKPHNFNATIDKLYPHAYVYKVRGSFRSKLSIVRSVLDNL